MLKSGPVLMSSLCVERVAAGAQAVVTLGRAGWVRYAQAAAASNIGLLHLPPASPELNPTENIWQYLRQTYLSNRVFSDYDDVFDAAESVVLQREGRTDAKKRAI